MNEKKQKLHADILQTIIEENPNTDNYLVPDVLGKKVKSFMSIKSDVDFVHEALKELSTLLLMKKDEDLIASALWKSAMITYGKCFTNSQDGGHSKLEIKDCFKDEAYFIPIHESIMDVRNGFVAHRGTNEFEETVAYFKVDRNHPEYTEYAMKLMRARNNNFNDLVHYLNLVEHLQHYVENKIQDQLNKLHEHFTTKFSKEEINALLIR